MNRTSISDLKLKAKDQLLGNYGIAAGSFALLFVLMYTIMLIIMPAFTFGMSKTATAGGSITILQALEADLVGMVIGAISVTFSVGYIRILWMIADGQQPTVSELFFVFRNHPDKVIIISFIITGIQFVLLLPATVMQTRVFNGTSVGIDGKNMLIWSILYLAGFIASFIIDLMLSMCFMIYLDDPSETVPVIIRTSVNMMKGNKFRYFYMTLSFIGYWFLGILSLGIGFLWIVPYQTMTAVEFYLDLKGRSEDIIRYDSGI